MKKIKACACLMAALGLASTFGFTSCVKKSDDENTLEISVNIGGYGSESFKAIAKEFEKTHSGVSVVVNDVYLRLDQLEANLKNPRSTTTDLYVTGNGTLLKGYVAKGKSFTASYDGVILEDISSVYQAKVEGEDVTVGEKMYDEFRDFYTWDMNNDGVTENYIMPWHANVMSFIYNERVVNAVLKGKSLPRTTNEFLALAKEIKANGVNPFVLTLDPAAHYWQAPVETWWAQYSGISNYNNFFHGINNNAYSKDIYTDWGRFVGLTEMERLIYAPNGLIDPDSPSLEFSQAQNKIFNGSAAFMANGDWFENEMKDSDSKSNEARMMRTPVTSALSEKLSYYSDDRQTFYQLSAEKQQEYDTLLSSIVAYVDGEIDKESLDARIKENDISIVSEARKIARTNASTNAMFIPAFAKGKEIAKEFLAFMAKDSNLELFMDNTTGSHLVFDYDFNKTEERKARYDKLSEFRKSVYDIENNVSLIRFANEPIEYKGGLMAYCDLSTQLETYMISSNSGDRKTGKDIYDHCIAYMDDSRWDNILRLAGIK